MSEPAGGSAAWESYLVPGSGDALRNSAGLTDPVAIAIFERITTAQAEQELRINPAHARSFDLAHLSAIHRALFADVYPFAGQLRYVDLAKPGQTGEPFVHHAWVETYTAAVADQLRREQHLSELPSAGQWADRAGYYWAALTHAHPYREGNGRAIRIFLGELAEETGHQLDWGRASAARVTAGARAAADGGDLEPMRALLTTVTGGTLGSDRPRPVLDDLDRALRAEAWARTGLAFGTGEQREQLRQRLPALTEHIADLTGALAAERTRPPAAAQPATERWHGLAASLSPALVGGDDWPPLANALDEAAAAGVDVDSRLPTLAAQPPLPDDTPAETLRARLLASASPAAQRPAAQPPARSAELPTAPLRPAVAPRR